MNYFKTVLFAVILFAGCSSNTEKPKEVLKDSLLVTPTLSKSTTGHPQMDTLIDSLFAALKNRNTDAYKRIMPSEKEIQLVYLQLAPADRRKEIKQRMKEEGIPQKELKIQQELFELSIKRGEEQRINWKEIQLTSTSIDSSNERGFKIFNGEIGFREDNREFNLKFSDCFLVEKRMVITNVAIPIEDQSNINLAKNQKYKESYLRRCVNMVKHHTTASRNGMSTEKYCECSFNTIAKQTYGEDNLKDTTQLHLQPGNCK